MFDSGEDQIGLFPGESTEAHEREAHEREDQLAYEITCRELADGWVDEERHILPSELESLPLYFQSIIVMSTDRSRMNGYDVVRLMQAEHRLASSFDAEMLASISEVAHCLPGNANSPVERTDNAFQYAAPEVATALRWTRRRSERMVDHALSLRERLPAVWDHCRAGRLSPEKARVFVQALGHHSEELIEEVLARTLDQAGRLTVGQLNARLRRCAMEADPDAAGHDMVAGLADRRVTSCQNPDLTGSIFIHSSHPQGVAGAMANIEAVARALRAMPGEERTLDQIRNDVAIDLLQGKTLVGNAGGGRVLVTIPADTLHGGSGPGALEGFGPIPAEIARKVAFDQIDGDWEFVVTDNGQPVATGTLSRRPTAAMQRRVRALYPTCVFPGCRRPAPESDLDHNREWHRGGSTSTPNLAPLCRHHHGLRNAGWRYHRLEDGGHRWMSPCGHTYLSERGPPV